MNTNTDTIHIRNQHDRLKQIDNNKALSEKADIQVSSRSEKQTKQISKFEEVVSKKEETPVTYCLM